MIYQAERLADTLPDSTVRLIDSVLRMPVSFSERERMDMALLQAEALFGCRDGACTVSTISPIMDDDFFDNHGNISTSPELERAAAYYAKKKQYDKAAYAALYSGFVQQHYGEKETAMRSFKEAEQYGTFGSDSFVVAQAEYWMGKMLLGDGMKQEALSMLQAAELGIGDCLVDKALVLNMMGVCYMVQDSLAKAETCFKKSLAYSEQGNSFKVKKKSLNNYAVLCRLQRKYDQAIYYLKQIVDGADLTNTEEILLYLNLGKTFEANGESDSAFSYYQRLERIIPIAAVKNETKASVYGTLSQFAEKQGNIEIAMQYKEQRENLLSIVLIERQKQTIYRIQQHYNYESLQNEMNKKIIQRQNTILIISVLFLISTIMIMILKYKHKQLLESEKAMKQQIDAMKQDLRQTVKSSIVDNEIATRLRTILLATRTTQRANDPKKEWQPLIMQIMNGGQNPFEAARNVLETAYPRLYSSILENYPDLTETEAKVCLLSCSELSNAEMAEILGLSLNTVNQNRSNLRKKLNLKPDKMKEQLRMALSK